MLPRARTMLAAMFVTVILVTVIATTIVPVPADSYVDNSAALPQVEQPPGEHARTASPKAQSRMPGYARLKDDFNQTPPVESSSNTTKTMDGGNSTHAKTQARWSEYQVERAGRGSPPAPDPEQPASNSNTKSADVAPTANVNGASIATAEPPAPQGDAAVSPAAAPKSGPSDCDLHNRRIDFQGFPPVHSRMHAHHSRLKVARWQRTWTRRRVLVRTDPRAGIPGTDTPF